VYVTLLLDKCEKVSLLVFSPSSRNHHFLIRIHFDESAIHPSHKEKYNINSIIIKYCLL
jgi:hypothetical protein